MRPLRPLVHKGSHRTMVLCLPFPPISHCHPIKLHPSCHPLPWPDPPPKHLNPQVLNSIRQIPIIPFFILLPHSQRAPLMQIILSTRNKCPTVSLNKIARVPWLNPACPSVCIRVLSWSLSDLFAVKMTYCLLSDLFREDEAKVVKKKITKQVFKDLNMSYGPCVDLFLKKKREGVAMNLGWICFHSRRAIFIEWFKILLIYDIVTNGSHGLLRKMPIRYSSF